MSRHRRFAKLTATVLAICAAVLEAQTVSHPYGGADQVQWYAKMLNAVQNIKVFDDHSHPGFADDQDVDAMVAPPGSSALRLRVDNPELTAASKALFGYPYADFSHEHMDPRYESVNFVLLHGGFLFDRAAIWLAARRNVYLDSSLADLYLYPSEFKNVLKYWLSTYPEKVLFGSDAFPFNEAVGAEETYWLSVQSSREALAAALAEVISEHAISETQTISIARGYLHDNAAALYRPAR